MFFLWLALRNADLDAVKDALAEARFGPLALTVLVLAVGYGFQAARWQRIADAPSLGFRSFYGMLLGGLACNNVLPVRIGEFLRAGWLSRDAPMSGGSAFGSVVLDRICDVVTLAVFFAIGLQVGGERRLAGQTRDRRAPRGRRDRRRARAGSPVLGTRTAVAGSAPARSRRPDPSRHGRDARRADRASTCGDLARAVASARGPCRRLPRRSSGARRDRPQPARRRLRHVRAGTRRGDPVVARIRRHVSVDRRRRARPARRPVEQALAFSILMQATWYVPTTLAGGAVIGLRAIRGRPVREPDPELA